MSVRTVRRLGDTASDNISTAVWGNTAYGVQTGQQGLIDSVNSQLAAQGINPATASRAQILSVYFAGQAAQALATSPQLASVAAQDTQQAQAWAAQAGTTSPSPVTTPQQPYTPVSNVVIGQPISIDPGISAAVPSTVTSFLGTVPTWAKWAAAGGAALLLFRK
jgi:hypothetical protein